MGLLEQGPPPRAGDLFCMPPRLYDDTDLESHPVLVLNPNPMTGWVQAVTRTSRPEARGRHFVVDPANPTLARNAPGWFDKVGWWRLGAAKSVPMVNFTDPDARKIGRLDDQALERVLREWRTRL
jgi:hypothetical protein